MGIIMNKYPRIGKTLVGLVLASSGLCYSLVMADPGIFRCGEAGNQSWSQIPCEESSEQVVIEDHRMITEAPPPKESAGSLGGAASTSAGQAQSVNNVQAFIQQLDSQRIEQLAEIDRNILALESRSGQGNDGAEGDNPVDTAELIAELKESRKAIVTEYEAMISAAQQRMDAN
jgi:hypothetical protein